MAQYKLWLQECTSNAPCTQSGRWACSAQQTRSARLLQAQDVLDPETSYSGVAARAIAVRERTGVGWVDAAIEHHRLAEVLQDEA